MASSFADAKVALVAAVLLSHPLPGAVLSLATNAFNNHVREVLPLCFYSKKTLQNQGKLLNF
jgi:hypothetical protein